MLVKSVLKPLFYFTPGEIDEACAGLTGDMIGWLPIVRKLLRQWQYCEPTDKAETLAGCQTKDGLDALMAELWP